MILLNKLTGEIEADQNIFTANTTSLELDSLSNKYNINIHTTDSGSKFYRIPNVDNGESSLQFLFYHNKLHMINIGIGINYDFPPFVITEEEKRVIKKKLNDMGGEKLYPWGSVEYSEDIKGGSVSVIIKYKT